VFRFDYLMPAELFPVAFVGGGRLMWVALRASSRRGLIGGGLAAAVGLLLGGWALAAVTGGASGETEPAGWFRAFVVASLVIYSLALVEIGVALPPHRPCSLVANDQLSQRLFRSRGRRRGSR